MEIFPVYFIETNNVSGLDRTLIVEEVELSDMLAIQDNFWALQAKLADTYRTIK